MSKDSMLFNVCSDSMFSSSRLFSDRGDGGIFILSAFAATKVERGRLFRLRGQVTEDRTEEEREVRAGYHSKPTGQTRSDVDRDH